MYFRGGRLRFGKLTMQDTDLMLVDAAPADPFRFNLAEYARQLVAGYSKTLRTRGSSPTCRTPTRSTGRWHP